MFYYIRALSLIYNEWKLFFVGMVFLVLSNAVSLMMPYIQGSILNSVGVYICMYIY